MSKKANFFAIGVFVTAGAVLACITVLVFGSGVLRRDTLTYLATFRGSANGLMAGSKVKAYGVEIGEVEEVLLHGIPEDNELVIPVLFNIDRNRVRDLMDMGVDRRDPSASHQEAIQRGIHARLATQSVVTGMLYVELSYGLEGEGFVLESNRFAEYYSIPTVPTDLEILMRALETIIDNIGSTDVVGLVAEAKGVLVDLREDLEQVDFHGIGTEVKGVFAETREKLNSPEAEKLANDFIQVAESMSRLGLLLDSRAESSIDQFDASLEQLRSSLEQLEETSRHADAWLSPDSAVHDEAVQALNRISEAASAVRALVDFIDRNPNALLTGRKKAENP